MWQSFIRAPNNRLQLTLTIWLASCVFNEDLNSKSFRNTAEIFAGVVEPELLHAYLRN